jgi:hypothetical protein
MPRWHDFARVTLDLGYIWRARTGHRSPDGAVAPAIPER